MAGQRVATWLLHSPFHGIPNQLSRLITGLHIGHHKVHIPRVKGRYDGIAVIEALHMLLSLRSM